MARPVTVDADDHTLTFECPHCGGLVQVAQNETNCRIFRHAAYRATQQPINPHAGAAECAQLLADGLVDGCAGPFELVLGPEPYAQVCGYV